MEEKIKISMLLDLYGNFLTVTQFEFMNDYYNNDLSLSEIAENNNNITRQAVRDVIKKGEKKLMQCEEKLLFMEKTIKQKKSIEFIIKELEQLEKEETKNRKILIIDTIKKELNRMV